MSSKELALKKMSIREAAESIGSEKVYNMIYDVWQLKEKLNKKLFDYFILTLSQKPDPEIKDLIARIQTEVLLMNEAKMEKNKKIPEYCECCGKWRLL